MTAVARLEQDALARNDRYLREFVESYDLCPFARRCRESGGLERRVVLGSTLDLTDTLPLLAELAEARFDHVEVALLIFPAIQADFPAFEHFAAMLREARAALEGAPTFYVVPFHPDSPPDVDTPHRLVSFLRRSPDPTLQLVRASLLERVRGRDTEDTVWADPATLDFDRPPPKSPPSLSTRIAEANFETARKAGAETLRVLLDSRR